MLSTAETDSAEFSSLVSDVDQTINMTGVEQRCQMRDEHPTVKDYQERRMGSSAVGVCLAVTE